VGGRKSEERRLTTSGTLFEAGACGNGEKKARARGEGMFLQALIVQALIRRDLLNGWGTVMDQERER